jgi:hypothetical protein
MDLASIREFKWEANLAGLQTSAVHKLAERIQIWADGGTAEFTRADAKLLTEIGEKLVRDSERMLNSSPPIADESREPYESRVRNGQEILELRDAIAARLTSAAPEPR